MFLHVVYSGEFQILSLEILDNSENSAIKIKKKARKLATLDFFVFSFCAGVYN